jgi:hypothetical protein
LESTQQNIPLVSSTPIINVSHITINVSYNTETDVNITNWTLRYYPNGVSDNTNYIDTYPQIIGGISYGKNEYDFDIPYADNGQYILMIRGVDDDGNTKDYNTAIITVKHPDNVITLISPIVGIGSTKEHSIVLVNIACMI